MKHLFFFIFVMMMAGMVQAGQVTIPNTFTSGTAAVAAEVNDNFTTVANGVNANDVAINANTVGVGANATSISTNTSGIGTNVTDIGTNTFNVGVNTSDISTNASDIGTLQTDVAAIQVLVPKTMHINTNNGTDLGVLMYRHELYAYVMTYKGYTYRVIELDTGNITISNTVFYEGAGCTGQPYLGAWAGGVIFYTFVDGIVYTAMDEVPAIREFASYRDRFGNCTVAANSTAALPAYPNDFAVTGAIDPTGLQPFTFEYR